MKGLHFLAAAFLAALAPAVHAQTDGLLYDPQPPANSAYVRVINAVPESAIDVAVDGRMRLRGVATGTASDYLVLPAGKRTLAIGPAGKPAQLNVPVDVASGRALTIAFNALRPDAKPWIFEDQANTNKLKAVVAVYYLAGLGTPIDVTTGDGSTKVFTSVAPGSSTGRSVNPIRVDLVASAAGTTAALAHSSLSMAAGGTYSVVFLPGAQGKLAARAFVNTVERYTGKPAAAK